MRASNSETIYSAGFQDWTQARLITVSGSASACTVPMSHRDKQKLAQTKGQVPRSRCQQILAVHQASWPQLRLKLFITSWNKTPLYNPIS